MLEAVLLTSCVGTVLAALIVLFKPLTKRIFPRGWHYYIWLAVLAVMLFPVRFSPPAAVERMTVDAVDARKQSALEAKVYNTYDGGKNIGADKLWICIAALLFVSKLGNYVVFVRRIRRSSIELDLPEMTKITVLKSGAVTSPMMYGVIKPVLVLPDIELTSEQLGNILAHEMTHFKRRDIVWKWLAVIVKCVHWFNPAVYFICRQMNTECEISCDAVVVEKMNPEQELSYVNTILALLDKSRVQPLTTGMTGSKGMLKKRFAVIRDKRSFGTAAKIASAAVAAIAVVSAAFVSGALAGGFFGGGGDLLEYEFGEKMSADRLIGSTDRVAAGSSANLKREYLLFDYSFDSRADYKMRVTPDAEGNITVFFDTDFSMIVADISLTPKNGAETGYRMPTDSSRAYCFGGCDKSEEYLLEISGYCPGNYGINGKILIY